MRKRLYEIIEVASPNDKISIIYDKIMILSIIVSIIPIAFKQPPVFFDYTDAFTTAFFITDYILRWGTADFKMNKKSVTTFIKYPFTLWAIIDLLSILPTISSLNNGFKLFRVCRAFRVIRVFKLFRYSKEIKILARVIQISKRPLLTVFFLAVGYILISALLIFNIEADSFETFFDAIYWATVSLTTVGYGDIYPVTTAGRIITMISSMFGIAVVALPSGIITAGYVEALTNGRKEEKE